MLKPKDECHSDPNQTKHLASQTTFESPEVHLKPPADPNNVTAHCQNQTALPLEANLLRSASPISIAATESSLNLCNDDAELMRRISRLLQLPIVPRSQELVGPSGRPLGVEVAINAYQRGELSSEAVDSVLVPSALLKIESSKEQTPHECCSPDCQCSKLQVSRDSCGPLAVTTEAFGKDSTSADQSDPARKHEHLEMPHSQWSPHQCHSFNSIAQTWEESLLETYQFPGQLIEDDALNLSAENEVGSKTHSLPSDCYCSLLTLLSPFKQNLDAQYVLASQEPTLAQLASTSPAPSNAPPITPEWVELLRSQLPQAHHLRDTVSCSPEQAKTHPALRMPSRLSTQDKDNDDSGKIFNVRNVDPALAKTYRCSEIFAPASALPVSKSLANPSAVYQMFDVPTYIEQKPKAMLDGNRHIQAADMEVISSTASSELRCDSLLNTARSSISTCPSSHSIKQGTGDCPMEEENATHILWSREVPSNMTEWKTRPKSTPEELQTLLSLLPPVSSNDNGKRQKDTLDRRRMKANLSKDGTYLRVQSMLFAERPSAPNKPRPSPNLSFRKSLNRGSSLFSSSKLAEFFGEEYTKAAQKPPAVSEKENSRVVGQIVRENSKRLSGVGEDVKKGLRRLLG